MHDRNAQLRIVAATILIVIVVILLMSNVQPVDHQCAWQFPKIASCLLSARETLSAGLIGAGGAVFAGWLAYSAAQEASGRALDEARAAKRATLTEQVTSYGADIDRLRLATAYLQTFANNFPPTTQGGSSVGFTQVLRQCHAQALDFVSSSATRAPFGYGAQITTTMTRVETLGDRIENMLLQQPVINPDATWSAQIFEMIAGIRILAEQIAADIPVHEKHLLRLADERDAIKVEVQ
jgi:hypothetical protein